MKDLSRKRTEEPSLIDAAVAGGSEGQKKDGKKPRTTTFYVSAVGGDKEANKETTGTSAAAITAEMEGAAGTGTVDASTTAAETSPHETGLRRDDGSEIIPVDDLAFLFDTIGRPEKTLKQLREQHGITSVVELLNRKSELEAARLPGIQKTIQEELHRYCLWHEDFCTKNPGDGARWQEQFHEDSLSNFEKRGTNAIATTGACPSIKDPEYIFSYAKQILHQGQPFDSMGIHTEEDYQRMYDHAAKIVIGALPDDLKAECYFPLYEHTVKYIRAIFNLPSGDPYPRTFLCYGKTQGGKSAVKAIVNAICALLNVRLYVITKGVQESKDLWSKILCKLGDSIHKLSFSLSNDNLMVVADTGGQVGKVVRNIKKLRNDIPKCKFVVIVDECDAMYRTEEGTQRFEKAYSKLMDLAPCLRIEISATPLTTLIILVLEKKLKVELLKIGTSADYSGIEAMRPFRDAKGDAVFLSENPRALKEMREGVPYSAEEGDLQEVDTKRLFNDDFNTFDNIEEKKFPSCEDLEFIPYTNESIMNFYVDAVSDRNKKGILVLDCSCAWVDKPRNMFEKACCVQHFLRSQGKNVVIVVNVGKATYFRRPGFAAGRKVSRERTFSEVISQLDKELTLDMPIFVFGYNISYRSNKRVPTHMILLLGRGHSIENYLQALGRATFNGRDNFKAKKHEDVTILSSKEGLQMAKKHYNYMDVVHERLENGESPEDVITGATGKFPDSANFLRHTKRKLGQRKNLRDHINEDELFESPSEDEEDSDDDELERDMTKKERYWDDTVAQRVLKSFVDLKEEERNFTPSKKQIEKIFNDTYQDDGTVMKKNSLNSILNDYEEHGVLQKFEQKSRTLWKVISWNEVKFLMNDKLIQGYEDEK